MGSASAWRARIQMRNCAGELVGVQDELLQRSFAGVREVFQRCLTSALESIESSHDASGNDLAVGYLPIEQGDYALWFDIQDRRGLFKRWVTTKESWQTAVDAVLREASSELMALLRGLAMALDNQGKGLMIRPVSGPEGVQSRVELSVPSQPAARLSARLWTWAQEPEGLDTVRSMFAVLAGADVAYVQVLLYPGTPHEQCVCLDATPEFAAFVRGDTPVP
ncbi:hypothetical protein [Kocuria sp.]|uniref:hypothetical protein n=1 Tax=Kocuria sp. TaxID=1871328 RepID=UPI0026E0D43F|nr:hypothetical protein [Kocuria sp.]MDO5618181.1 hypothetical protein [Kocuria sp.]